MITVWVLPQNATNRNVTITLSDPEVLSIEYKGQNAVVPQYADYTIKGLKAGICKIKAVSEDGGFEDNCDITVESVKVSKIKIGPENATIEVGETKQFAAAISPSDADNKEIEWSSSDTSIATVDANGLVTGITDGEVTITATAKDGSGVKGEATIKVVGIEPTAITIDGKTELEINTWHGKVLEFNIATTPAGADFTRLNWQFTDPYSDIDVMQYNLTKDKLTVDVTYPENTGALTGGHIKALSSDYKNLLAKVDIYCQTVAWLLEMKDGAITDDIWPLSSSTNKDKAFQFDWENAIKYNFVAYYNTNGATESSIPSTYYADNYIPTSEYTLTSSDPSKLKVTKESDGKSWKLERLNTSDRTSVTLTYTCGKHTQTYMINLIP